MEQHLGPVKPAGEPCQKEHDPKKTIMEPEES